MQNKNNLSSKILFTIFMIILYRFGSYIPIPGVDAVVMESLMQQNKTGIMGMFNMLSGGSLGRMSIFALAIMPYITSSIIIQLFSMSSKKLAELKKEGEQGRKKITQISRYLTIFIAATQGFAITTALYVTETPLGKVVLISAGMFKFIGVMSLVVGTMLLMWLGEQITAKGIGNGSSMIIFVGIISELPGSVLSSLELIRKGALPISSYFISALICFATLLFVVFCERALRKIPIQYPRHHHAPSITSENSHLPIKINISGVIPPMFADAMLRFPVTIANFSSDSDSIFNSISIMLSHGKPLFMILYSVLIIFFCFTYTAIVFNTEEVTNNMKKSNIIVATKRPGLPTQEYLESIVLKTTAVGALYILIICLLPEVFMSLFNISLVGGTTMMIIANVVMDTFSQIKSHTLSTKYEALSKRLR